MTKDDFLAAVKKMETEEQYKLMKIIFEMIEEENKHTKEEKNVW